MRTMRRSITSAALAMIAGAGALATHAPEARADEVSPTGKGISGGILLGAEVVTITESIAGVRNTLAYVIGGIVGAAAGGVGGYFVEQSSTNGRVPVYMLAGGLGLVIPAIVLTLNATRYMPDENATEDRAPTNGPIADPTAAGSVSVGSPGVSGTTTTPAPAPAPARAPAGGGGTTSPQAPQGPALSLVDVRAGAMRIGVPLPAVKPMWSMTEQAQYGMKQGTELRMPIFALTF